MAIAFSKSLAEFEARVGKLNRHASHLSDEMHGQVCKSRQLCSESHELIAKVDGLLERDLSMWHRK